MVKPVSSCGANRRRVVQNALNIIIVTHSIESHVSFAGNAECVRSKLRNAGR